MRVAVLDSLGPDGIDQLGHGSAVAATIRWHAPDAEIVPIPIFTDRLICGIDALIAAIEMTARDGVEIVNLSIGTANPLHAEPLSRAVDIAVRKGVTLVAAYGWLPGDLEGVLAVDMDPTLRGSELRTRVVEGKRILVCSGESVTGSRGISFAVANGTGLLAAAVLGHAEGSQAPLEELPLRFIPS